MRRRILLFHRLDLTDLFARMAGPLSDGLDVCHLAYGADEAARLRRLGIASGERSFKEEIAALHPDVAATPELLEEIDALIIAQTGGAFTLNSAIQSDRGFALLSYAEALRLTATYYRFWTRFLDSRRIDFMLHEPCTLMFNFLPALILAQRGGRYLYNIMAIGRPGTLNHLTMTGFDFTCPDLDRTLDDIAAGRLVPDRAAAAEFLAGFRKSFDVFLGRQVVRRPSLLALAAGAAHKAIVHPLRRARQHRVLDNIDYWHAVGNPSLGRMRNLLGYRGIPFGGIVPGERYFFYPLHLEPEAVILYHGHGLYENQVKLIQNIAGQLPPGHMLYVKDHPHDQGYRDPGDYRRLAAVPNIRLLSAGISGKAVVRDAVGVITVTGTAGFEGLLLGKQVYTFGKCFYSRGPGVTYVRNIRDLRAAIYARRGAEPVPEAEIELFAAAYLASLKPGLTDFFAGRAGRYGVDPDRNAAAVAASLLGTVARL